MEGVLDESAGVLNQRLREIILARSEAVSTGLPKDSVEFAGERGSWRLRVSTSGRHRTSDVLGLGSALSAERRRG